MSRPDPWFEAEYNIVAARGGVDDVMQRWTKRSAERRATADASLECVYGDHARERIDVFRCGTPGAPLYVYVHGGYWQRGDKSLYSFITTPFLDAGVDVAIVGYPLCPDVSMTAIVASLRRAIVWLYHNAGELGINPDRLNLSGHSAGGHLTAMALCTDWPAEAEDLPADLLKTVIPFSGLYDLEPLLPTTISDALQLQPEEIESLSPMRQTPRHDAPLLTILGGTETSEFFRQTDALHAAWTAQLTRMDRHVEPDVDHIDLIERLAKPDSQIFRRILDWLH